MRKNYIMPCAYGVSFTVNENIAASGIQGVESANGGLAHLPAEYVNGKLQVYVTDPANGEKIYADDHYGIIDAVKAYCGEGPDSFSKYMEIMSAWVPQLIMGSF